MKYVTAVWESGGFYVDPRAYLAELPELHDRLPTGALAFASDPGHYGIAAATRCVKDLELAGIHLATDKSGGLALEFAWRNPHPMDPQSIPDVRQWTQETGGDTDYLDYLSQRAGLGDWAAFARVFMPEFVEVAGCVLWDRVYTQDSFRTWHEHLRGDATAIEATLNQLRLCLYIDIPEDEESEQGALALAEDIAASWRRSLHEAFPDRAFEVIATETEDGPVVSFVTTR
ncbi:hypothetical protein [Streptomyces sp. NRRL S-813]|uniref:hypothetical protein n=1 Tax=Streptomyces sp. NRRL S-813 TaxID=1463919 RepID=UPI000AD11813|nr:hypothetical protein [Streptomyces sp. NRRL S-813]